LDYYILPGEDRQPPPPQHGDPSESAFGSGDASSDDPLDGVWNVREWVGLGLLSSTVLFAVSISLVASHLQRQREREEAWGAILTEEGIVEVLQVGWRYQQGGIPLPTTTDCKDRKHDVKRRTDDDDGKQSGLMEGQQQQQQLFLQIYDKAKEGYNDENSILQGGVEQRQYWGPHTGANNHHPSQPPTTTNTTETTTTA
jgi:hypothetical protein